MFKLGYATGIAVSIKTFPVSAQLVNPVFCLAEVRDTLQMTRALREQGKSKIPVVALMLREVNVSSALTFPWNDVVAIPWVHAANLISTVRHRLQEPGIIV